jgi:hypothetical protein
MSCSKGRRHAHVKGGKKLHVALKCYYKGKVLLSTHEGTLIDYKPNTYDGSYKGLAPQIGCQNNVGYLYELNAIKSYWKKDLFIG